MSGTGLPNQMAGSPPIAGVAPASRRLRWRRVAVGLIFGIAVIFVPYLSMGATDVVGFLSATFGIGLVAGYLVRGWSGALGLAIGVALPLLFVGLSAAAAPATTTFTGSAADLVLAWVVFGLVSEIGFGLGAFLRRR
jgi:hypothetical protein